MLPYGCRRWSLLWLCWIVLLRLCVNVSFVICGTEGRSEPFVCHKIYHRVEYHVNKYLDNFVASRNTRASATLGELGLEIPRCRTDQFNRPFLSAAVLFMERTAVGCI